MEVGSDNPFEKVLDRLREKGWRKGDFLKGESTCIVGASMALGSVIPHANGYTVLRVMITDQYPDRLTGKFGLIANFNDHPDTTFSDVERVLEKAAVKWEEERVMRDD